MAIPLTPLLTYGMLLKRHRRLQGMTQEQLAERAGFSVSYISMLERGERAPTVPSAALLAVALDLTSDERAGLDAALHRMMVDIVDGEGREQAMEPPDRQHGSDEPALPEGGFLGAAPAGPLVARAPELAVALAALDTALAGAGRLVTLVGEPGIGKTRLAQEVALIARARGALVATGRCDERQQAVGFAPIGEMLGQLHAMASPALRAVAAERWPAALTLLPDAPVDAPVSAAPQVVEQTPGERLRLLRQVAGLVEALAASRPVVLLLDDLHWADEASLDCVRHLARQTRGAPVFVLGTYRDVEVRRQPTLRSLLLDLVRERLVERIALRPLASDETAALLATALGAPSAVAADLGALIQDTTQGNPLFILEIARALAERGEVVLADGQWRRAPGPLAELDLPESVRAAIGERVARLSPAVRAMLRDASVLGPVFALDPLCAMGDQPVGEVEAALEEALAAEMIREMGTLNYGFSHALTQRAVYAEIPAPTRRRLHRAAGEALEHARAGTRTRHAAELAQHFIRGDAPERALPYVIQAGDQAARVYAQVEAHQQYSLAVDLARDLDDEEREAAARERRADVRYLLGQPEDAYADLVRATGIYRGCANWERLTWATCQMTRVCDLLGRTPETLPLVDALLALLGGVASGQQQGGAQPLTTPARAAKPATAAMLAAQAERACTLLSPQAAARLFLCLTARFAFLGRAEETITVSVPTIAHARQAALPRMESLALTFRASAQQALGRLDEAVETLEDARRVAESCGDLEAQFLALDTLADIHERRAAPRAAWNVGLRALDALARQDDISRRTALLGGLGWIAWVLGEWAEARARWSEAVDLGARGDHIYQWYAQSALAYLDHIEGKAPAATLPPLEASHLAPPTHNPGVIFHTLQAFTEAHMLAGAGTDVRGPRDLLHAAYTDASLDKLDKSEVAALLARLELRLDRAGEAERLLAQARQRADARGNRAAYATIWRAEALLALARGEWADAEKALDQALALCRAMPYPYAEAKALYVFGQVHQAHGDSGAARQRYREALAILTRLGEALKRAEVERALAALNAQR